MAWFSRLNPVPTLPDFPGPHHVGTVDVELSVADLESPVPRPDDCLTTISFRLFYPCEPNSPAGRPVRWIPKPQKQHLASTAKLMGASAAASSISSYLLRNLYYVTIPARRNAPILPPTTSSGRWPVLVFSHGLSGTRNGYSHLLGSLASHGLVVFAPDHHDGSAPVAHNRSTDASEQYTVPYRRIQHIFTDEVSVARNEQLRVRLWEIGLLHQAMLKMDSGEQLRNLDNADGGDALRMFESRLDARTPGAVTWAGHSFGAATMVQFVKSVFYRDSCPSESDEKKEQLFQPAEASAITAQVTPSSTVVLLDPWMLPLRAESTAWLWNKPMPCYAPSGPGGAGILTVLSEAFYNWKDHREVTMRLISPSPSSVNIKPSSSTAAPHLFYMLASAHPSQSDFCLIFPWITKTFLHAREPERLLRLNTRAILQLLRENGTELADSIVPEDEGEGESADGNDDSRILSAKGGVRAWVHIPFSLKSKSVADLDESEKVANNTQVESAATLNEVTA